MISTSAANFLARAKHEAERYGSDPWVLVRELLQNARDAGATRVEFETAAAAGRECITCRDNGSGMSFDHARRYLLTLYASSKRDRGTAGRFGIGFWSVLRFRPDVIVVRSQPSKGDGWEIRFDGSLQNLRRKTVAIRRGTEVMLERPKTTVDLGRSIKDAVLRDAPFLRRRDRSGARVDVLVDGRPVRGELELPPPSLSFSRRGLRGAVGLGTVPAVEIYAHGLRVREASSLDELSLSTRARPPAVPSSAEGFSPQVKIDSRNLSVLMARGDTREDRALNRLVAVGHRELRRLVGAELDRHVGASIGARIGELLRRSWSRRVAWAAILTIAVFMIAALLVGVLPRSPIVHSSAEVVARDGLDQNDDPTATFIPYRDLASRYNGPDQEGLGILPPPIDLRYDPPDRRPFIAALRIIGIAGDGRVELAPTAGLAPYPVMPCRANCLEVDLMIDALPGLLRVPISTGHIIDATSVSIDGRPVRLLAGVDGQPILPVESAVSGRLRYRSARTAAATTPALGSWPPLPPIAEEAAIEIKQQALSVRARAAVDWVQQRISYDTSVAVASEHQEARLRGRDLFARSLEIGGGDCDIQNALVAAILERSGVDARLAVGWVGAEGRALAGLHAWVEYQDENGLWRVADASIGALAPTDVAPVSSATGRAGDSLPRLWPVIAVAVALSAVLLWLLVRPAWRRKYRAGENEDLSELLHGAAVRPEAFARVPSLFLRRVVPLLSGRTMSLTGAREAARRGRLACGRRRSRFARRASESGGLVVDLDRPEGSAVAGAFAAVDLDRWDAVLDRAQHNVVTERVEAALAAAGDPCLVRVSAGLGEEVAVLDGGALGFARNGCWVVLDQQSVVWRRVLELAADRPAAAALLLGDAVVDRLQAPPLFRRSSLGDLAREALAEAAVGLA